MLRVACPFQLLKLQPSDFHHLSPATTTTVARGRNSQNGSHLINKSPCSICFIGVSICFIGVSICFIGVSICFIKCFHIFPRWTPTKKYHQNPPTHPHDLPGFTPLTTHFTTKAWGTGKMFPHSTWGNLREVSQASRFSCKAGYDSWAKRGFGGRGRWKSTLALDFHEILWDRFLMLPSG